MKNLFPFFFVLNCFVVNANCIKNRSIPNQLQKQFIIASIYLPASISEYNLISDELDSTNIADESIEIEKQLPITRAENSCEYSECINLSKASLFPLLYDLPPPNSAFLI